MDIFKKDKTLDIGAERHKRVQQDFLSMRASEADINASILKYYTHHQYLLCPHTATATHAVDVLVAQGRLQGKTRTSVPVVLATAHAAKFSPAVARALDMNDCAQLDTPAALAELEGRPRKYIVASATRESVRYILDGHVG